MLNRQLYTLTFLVDRCIGQNVLCVGNVHKHNIVVFVLETFHKYRDDMRDYWAIILK